MRASTAPFVALLLLLIAGARDQCIPGPFRYEDNNNTNDGDQLFGPGNCFDPSCPEFVCNGNADCQNFLGPEARCESGTCRSQQDCTLGLEGECPVAGETCAYDADKADLLNGVCKPVSSSPIAAGDPCPSDVDENPCGGAAFCMPAGDEGICSTGCDNDFECDAGFQCANSQLNNFGGGRFMCMPACNLDAPDCAGERFVCTLGQDSGGASCTPDNGACVVVGCDADGCDELCSDGDDCAAGTFCIETIVDNCRVDGPDQTFASCSPPAGQDQPCVLTEPGSCENGLGCLPGFDGTPRCAQQAASTTADGDICDPNDASINRCEPGSYCARTETADGVCQRFCDGDDDCIEAGFGCARANISSGGATPEALAAVRVCAEACSLGGACPSGLTCDVDGGLCTGDGFCVPPENGAFCNDDNECTFPPSAICGGDSRCTLPEDTCLPQKCTVTDPTSCPSGFACSPFEDDVPQCVPQPAVVVADGESCTVFDGESPCAQGSVCAGVCMRFCSNTSDCTGAQECVRGNITDNGADPFRLYELLVCADPCIAGGACGATLSCDVDGDDNCNGGPGFCLSFESGTQGCSVDADCGVLPGTVCNTPQGQCVPPEDRCAP